MLLPVVFPIYSRLTSQSVNQSSGPVSLAAGANQLIPAGQWHVQPGPYTFVQVYDPISTNWRTLGSAQHDVKVVLSDGVNFRLANLSGCAAGAFITNVGSGYTSTPTVTASLGGSSWRAIVGGSINTTVTITAAGSGYLYPPTLLLDPPPAGGVQATAICAITAGAISSVTVINQGAGYAIAPVITILPDPRDTAGTGGTLAVNPTLAGALTVTAILCTDHGTPLTAVPTLTISGGGGASCAATAVMCFTGTAFAVTGAGVGYTSAPYAILTSGGIVPGTAGAVVNPAIGPGLFTPRQGNMTGAAGTTLVVGGQIVNDGGLYQAIPTGFVLNSGAAVQTGNATVTITVGGTTDTSLIYPA
jgi:hypothetical protein